MRMPPGPAPPPPRAPSRALKALRTRQFKKRQTDRSLDTPHTRRAYFEKGYLCALAAQSRRGHGAWARGAWTLEGGVRGCAQSRWYEYPPVRPCRSTSQGLRGSTGDIHTNWLGLGLGLCLCGMLCGLEGGAMPIG
eukprot:scaffold71055_cov59-Phaeocystis_antarctica.AAC.1